MTSPRGPSEQVADGFWEKVDRRGPDDCWPWLGALIKQSRGRFYVRGKTETAPRVALAISLERWLNAGEWALHRCDNPNCVNPAHLFVGTQSDNLHDCAAKGRHFQKSKTHCTHGHEFTPENTIIARGGSKRNCRRCSQASWRRYGAKRYAALRAKAAAQ